MKTILLLYLVGLPLGFFLFLVGFQMGLFSGSSIIFYRGLKIAALVSLAQWAALALVISYLLGGRISLAHAFAATMGSLAISISFLIVVPVSLDRSVSVFLLGTMGNSQQAISELELEGALESVYIKEDGAVDRRMHEQLLSGNVIVDKDGRYRLSKQGMRFIWFSKKVAGPFGVDMRYLDPKIEVPRATNHH